MYYQQQIFFIQTIIGLIHIAIYVLNQLLFDEENLLLWVPMLLGVPVKVTIYVRRLLKKLGLQLVGLIFSANDEIVTLTGTPAQRYSNTTKLISE